MSEAQGLIYNWLLCFCAIIITLLKILNGILFKQLNVGELYSKSNYLGSSTVTGHDSLVLR